MHPVQNMSRRSDDMQCQADLQICATNYNFNGLAIAETELNSTCCAPQYLGTIHVNI